MDFPERLIDGYRNFGRTRLAVERDRYFDVTTGMVSTAGPATGNFAAVETA